MIKILNLRKKAEDAALDLPALIAAAQNAVASILHGEHPQRKAGAGERFWQYRDYQPGDRPQDIDWRQSAKTDRVYIRQKEWQTTQTTLFWCARNENMDFSSNRALPTKAETAKILTLALSILLNKAGEQIGMVEPGKRGRSPAMIDHIGNILCDPEKHTPPLPDIAHIKLPRGASLIQIGDFLEPLNNIEKTFSALSHQTDSGLVLQILDPAEIDLPFEGRVTFEEPAHHIRETVDHVSSIRAEYKNRITAHTKGLEKLCARNGWTYILHSTDRDIGTTLSSIWGIMSGGRI